MRKKVLFVICMFLILSFALAGCGSPSEDAGGKSEEKLTSVVDQGGNEVQLPENISKIAVTPIPWASVIWMIDGGSERIISINPSAMARYDISFMPNIDAAFANISTAEIASDFTINVEALLNLKPEIAFIWNDQEAEYAQLKSVGITPIMLNYAEDLISLKKDFLLVGQVLGKEKEAEKLSDYHTEVENYFINKKSQLASAEKVKVLYLQNNKPSIAGAKNINNYLIELTGGTNVASGVDKKWAEVNMEQIMDWNPEIIYLSNFDKTLPEDLYENKIEGQDWSNIDAVKNHRVYKTPAGIYLWDAPCIETPFMLKWMGSIQQPEVFKDYDIYTDLKSFYKDFISYELTDENIDTILNVKVNN
ncbi:MAG: ABC transporter substrate-binding protein [Dehalobacterium sp.]